MIGGVARRISSPEFVGRQAELNRLIRAFEASAEERGTVILIAGEAGIGKTRLVHELSRLVEGQQGRVLQGGCVEMGDAGLPFAPIIEVLDTLRAEVADEEFLRLIGPANAELLRLVPGVGANREMPDDELGSSAQARLFAQIASLLERLAAARRTILVLEDLHWADRSTRDLIRFLARSRRRPGVLLVLTYRADAMHRRHPLRPHLAELERLDNVESIELRRFDVHEVTAQIAGIIGAQPPPKLAATLHERGDGNPFFIEELVATRLDGDEGRLPETVRDLVVARASRLDQATQALLRSMSVIGRQADHELLAAVTDLPQDALILALRAAVDERVLVALDGSGTAAYAFRHALLQEALYDELLPAERTFLHRAVATQLEATARPGQAGRQAEIAVHWERARDAERAVAASIGAAEEAAGLLAFGEAQGHFERILSFWSSVPNIEQILGVDRAAIAERAAAAAASAGSLARAIALGQEALREVDEDRDQSRAFRLQHWLVRHLWDHGAGDEAAAILEAGLARIDVAGPADRARLVADVAEQRWHAGQYAAMLDMAREAVALAKAAREPVAEARARAVLGTAQASLGDVVGGLEEIERAIQVPELDAATRSYYTVWLTHVLELGGYHQRSADTAVADLERIAEIGVADWLLPYEATNALDPLIQAGRWDEAERLLSRLDWPPHGNRASSWVHESAAELQVYRGDLEAAQRSWEQTREVATATSYVDRMWLARTDGLVLRALGRLDEASQALFDLIEMSPDPTRDVPLTSVLGLALEVESELAIAADARRDAMTRDEARARGSIIAGYLETVVNRSGERMGPIGRVYRALVAAERGRIEGRSAPELWAAVAAAAADNQQPYDQARMLYREAEAWLQIGRERTKAVAALTDARAIAESLRAAPLLNAIDELAVRGRLALAGRSAAAGSEPGPAAGEVATPVQGGIRLSPREREVLELVALGHTNREIADALFISHKTASVHVTHILDKLGVASRVEAALVAARAGMLDGDASSAKVPMVRQ